ncbi:MAG: hypothetical protein WC055_01850 [Melioribacteraceae bacterium]|nr:hypothetical protein [Melioribacteraceae bacterium]
MAKTQSFGDKAKGKKQSAFTNVKVIKTVKAGKSYKFHEKFVKLDDMSKVTTL